MLTRLGIRIGRSIHRCQPGGGIRASRRRQSSAVTGYLVICYIEHPSIKSM